MAIYEHIEEFFGKKVEEYNPSKAISEPENKAFRLSVDWDDFDSDGEKAFEKLFTKFSKDTSMPMIEALIIGDWGGAGQGDTSASVVQLLVNAQKKIKNLRALFIGEMSMEESEISWIEQCDLSPLWQAFPKLEHFQVRGGNNLSLGKISLPYLKSLIVETGGLEKRVIDEICKGRLPNLTQLELWLGTEEYGGDTSCNDLKPLLKGNLFPELDKLGLCNCEYVDEIAEKLKTAPVVKKLKQLNLSLGNLSDKGGDALLSNPEILKLEHLNLHFHYLSDAMMKKLSALSIDIDLSEQQEADEYNGEIERYIAHAE